MEIQLKASIRFYRPPPPPPTLPPTPAGRASTTLRYESFRFTGFDKLIGLMRFN